MTYGTPWYRKYASTLPGNKYRMDNSGLDGLKKPYHDLNDAQIKAAHAKYLRDMEKQKPDCGYSGRLRTR